MVLVPDMVVAVENTEVLFQAKPWDVDTILASHIKSSSIRADIVALAVSFHGGGVCASGGGHA